MSDERETDKNVVSNGIFLPYRRMKLSCLQENATKDYYDKQSKDRVKLLNRPCFFFLICGIYVLYAYANFYVSVA